MKNINSVRFMCVRLSNLYPLDSASAFFNIANLLFIDYQRPEADCV